MNKLHAVQQIKTFRQKADNILQDMKDFKKQLSQSLRDPQTDKDFSDGGEVIAQHTLSIRDLESCIMREGMALKYVGNPDPYPESRNPESPVVAPTADGLKL